MKPFFLIGIGLLISTNLMADAFTRDTLVNWLTNGAPENFILVDLRDASELASSEGTIGNLSCHPYNLSWYSRIFHAKMVPAIVDTSTVIVVYCASGTRAGYAFDTLISRGYRHACNAGGFSSWKNSWPALTLFPIDTLPATQLPAPSMLASTRILSTRRGLSHHHPAITMYYIESHSHVTITSSSHKLNPKGQVLLHAGP